MTPGASARLEAGDVLLDGGIEQRHVLRQIADEAAQRFLVPLRQLGIVEPDAAAQHRPDARQGPHQRGLAAAARTDDAERLAGLQLEADVAEQHAAGARRRNGDLLDLQASLWRRQLHRRLGVGERNHRLLKALEGGAAATTPFQLPIARSTGARARGRGDERR